MADDSIGRFDNKSNRLTEAEQKEKESSRERPKRKTSFFYREQLHSELCKNLNSFVPLLVLLLPRSNQVCLLLLPVALQLIAHHGNI
jgi:hypothetical protein